MHLQTAGARAIVFIALIASSVAPTAAFAQRAPLYMAHGIRSGASTWDATASVLRSSYPVEIHRQTTPWKQPYAAQRLSLLPYLAQLPETTIAVGHSNGGIVMRNVIRQGTNLRALATVGSPNKGAPAAAAVRDGAFAEIVLPVASTYGQICYIFCQSAISPAEQYGYYLLELGNAVLAAVVNQFVNFMEFDASFPIWQEMFPSSAFMSDLNSPGTRSLEEQQVLLRANVRTKLSDPESAFWSLVPGGEDVRVLLEFLTFDHIFRGFDAQATYCTGGSYDPTKCAYAYLWFEQAINYTLIEELYCARIQDETARGYAAQTCYDGDGVVPFDRQVWRDASFAQDYVVTGPSHIQQTADVNVRVRLQEFLRVQNNLLPCGSGVVSQLTLTGIQQVYLNTPREWSVGFLDACEQTTANTGGASLTATSSNPAVVSIGSAGGNSVTLVAHAEGGAIISVGIAGAMVTRSVSVPPESFILVNILGGSSTLSLGDEAPLTAEVVTGAPIVSYEWRVDGGAVVSSQPYYSHWYTGPCQVSVVVTNAAGQSASATTYLSGGVVQGGSQSLASRIGDMNVARQ
jgi:pimeloyl-ACP methyl ester carboxylesterase